MDWEMITADRKTSLGNHAQLSHHLEMVLLMSALRISSIMVLLQSSLSTILPPSPRLSRYIFLTWNNFAGQPYGAARSIELDVEIGADARDWNAIQAAEKLKPLEMELRRVEAIVGEVVNEMEYLRRREQRLRDTNESTNDRVKFFAITVMLTLVCVGSWQVIYLRSYFRYVYKHSNWNEHQLTSIS